MDSSVLKELAVCREGDNIKAKTSKRVTDFVKCYIGKNRVSMSVTLFSSGNGPVHLCAITSGGSQAMFFKINTWGEESFLDKLKAII